MIESEYKNTSKLRLIVADDCPGILAELTSVLRNEFDVLGTATNGRSALEQISRWQPDVVVLDLAMPAINGIDVTKEVMTHSIHPAVVICSVENDPEIIQAALSAGALAYVSKLSISADLILAVKSAARGQIFVSTVLAAPPGVDRPKP